jgi:hypothetical protein
MNHKRRRPKHQRAGCLFCKPQKDERETKIGRLRPGQRRKLQPDDSRNVKKWEHARVNRES